MFKKITLPVVGAALLMGLASAPASALTLAGACSVNSVTIWDGDSFEAADSCYGIYEGNVETSGTFGYTTQLAGWGSFAGDAWTTVAIDFTDGAWSSNAILGSEELIIVLKQASWWGAWYFNPIPGDDGTWTTAWGSFIGQQGGTDVEEQLSHGFALVRGTTSVPEPTTLALFGLGLLGVGLARRRKAA